MPKRKNKGVKREMWWSNVKAYWAERNAQEDSVAKFLTSKQFKSHVILARRCHDRLLARRCSISTWGFELCIRQKLQQLQQVWLNRRPQRPQPQLPRWPSSLEMQQRSTLKR